MTQNSQYQPKNQASKEPTQFSSMQLKSHVPLGDFHLHKVGSETLDGVLFISLHGQENPALSPLPTSCGTLVSRWNASKPQYLHLQNGHFYLYLPGTS